MRRYSLGATGQTLLLSREVLGHFARHRQTRLWHREAGGLLFARFDEAAILVDLATGPRRKDSRWRYGYRPDRLSEQREIDENHALGLHFVGTWHTHPEDTPRPSEIDLRSIAEIFARSEHALNGFAMIVVGRCPTPDGLFVGVWDGSAMHRLNAVLETVDQLAATAS